MSHTNKHRIENLESKCKAGEAYDIGSLVFLAIQAIGIIWVVVQNISFNTHQMQCAPRHSSKWK